MGYVATKREETNFRYLHSELFRILEMYQDQKSVKLNGSALVSPEYGDFIIQKKVGPFNKTILTISPPYTSEGVNVRDSKFHDLGEQIKEEIDKFWQFGKHYIYKGEEGMQKDYKARIFAKQLSYAFERIDESSSEEDVEEDLEGTLRGESELKTKEEKRQQYLNDLERALSEVTREISEEFLKSQN